MIPTYQIHNVLKAFTRNLVHDGSRMPTPFRETATAPTEGKRQAVMEKITDSILSEITKLPAIDAGTQKFSDDRPRPDSGHFGIDLGRQTRFAYQTLDANGEKQMRVCLI